MVHYEFSERPVQWAFPKEQNEPRELWGTQAEAISLKKVEKRCKMIGKLHCYTKF
jgi:hypothetical protein